MSDPTRRERFRPLELLVISAIVAVFVGLVVLLSTRDLLLGGIFAGVGFIVALVVFAMLSLASRPDGAELTDLDDQDTDQNRGH